MVFRNSEAEAEGLANFIHHKLITNQVELGDVLVLANWREIAYGIRNRLVQLGHDAHSYFSEQSLDSEEAKKALILFTLLADPNDLIAIRSWLAIEGGNSQNRAGYRRILSHAVESSMPPKDILDQLRANNLTLPYTNRIIESYNNLQIDLENHQNNINNLELLIESLLPEEQLNLLLLRQAAFRALELIVDFDIHTFVDELRKQIGQPEVPLEADHIRLMSLHKSKGLTAKLVVIAGLVEGLIPKSSTENISQSDLNKHLQEQRRVLYVGITRTTETLVLSKFQQIRAQSAHICSATVGRWAGQGIRYTIASSFFQEFGSDLPRAIRGDLWEFGG